MEKVGVALVIDGLAAFQSGMGKADSTLRNLIPTSKLLGNAFQWVGGIISGFVGGVARTLEYALGSLISAAIQKVIGYLKELGAEVIANTSEFQKMEVRLNRMNFNELSEDIRNSGKAMEFATAMTKEQVRWINKLAASTPFDAKNIAQTFTLARTYGFTADEAKKLTVQISDFAAGMGLSGTHIERIVQNLGQMKAAGKITGTELRDLARGAFVPVNDVLKKAAENLGITTDQLSKLRQQGLTDAEVFFTAFGGLVEEDFKGATEDMNAVLAVATENIKDMFGSMLSLEVMGPIFEVLAGGARGLQQALFERWDVIEGLFAKIGEIFAEMLTDIFGLVPTSEAMADGIVGALSSVTGWLNNNKDGIVDWVKKSAAWINDTLIPAIKDLNTWLFGVPEKKPIVITMEQDYKNKGLMMPDGEDNPFAGKPIVLFGTGEEGKAGAISKALKSISKFAKEASKWVGEVLVPFIRDDLQPVLLKLQPLADAVGKVLATAFDLKVDQSFSDWLGNTLIPFIEDLTKWIGENNDKIAFWVKMLSIGAVAGFLLAGAIGILISILWELAAAVIGGAILGAVALWGWLEDVGIWARAMEYKFFEWAFNTWQIVKQWAIDLWTSITEWASSTRDTIVKWGIDMWFAIIMWGINTYNSIVGWVEDTKASISEWVTTTLAQIIAWAGDMVLKIQNWITDTKDAVKTGWDDIKTEMMNKMKAIGVELESKARGWITRIASGFQGMADIVIEALNTLIAEIQSGLSEIIIGVSWGNPGDAPTGGSTGGGTQKKDKVATGTHGWRTVPPGFNNDNFNVGMMSGERYMVIPRGGQMSSAMAGSTVNSSRSVQNTMNLNIISSAPTESIVADFAMMSSMIGN